MIKCSSCIAALATVLGQCVLATACEQFTDTHPPLPSNVCGNDDNIALVQKSVKRLSKQQLLDGRNDHPSEKKAEEWRRSAQAFLQKHGRKQRLVFIGGAPRTGTTLAAFAFKLHPDVSMPEIIESEAVTLEPALLHGEHVMSSEHQYKECEGEGKELIRHEEDASQHKIGVMAEMFDAGFNLSAPVLMHKRPSHAWSMRMLQAIFAETHHVQFLISVKHPLDVHPDRFGCDPDDHLRQTVSHNLASCYTGLFKNVLPSVNDYFVLRTEDWFLKPKRTLSMLEKHFGLEPHLIAKTVDSRNDDDNHDKGLFGDSRVCPLCDGDGTFTIDFKYFGVCENAVAKASTVSWDSAVYKVFKQLGYHPQSVRKLSESAFDMDK